MLKEFQRNIKEFNLFGKEDKILLAVSGGKDSMAMLDLFINAKLNFFVSHCNFNLRGNDSDNDELFVKDYCKKNKIHFTSISFNTEEYAIENKLSTQMAARKLRYDWFEKIRVENNAKYIATAHHKNDVAETMLINLTKGSGISGLHGIKRKKNNIIRPILDFNRIQIEEYIFKNSIPYREDKSNLNNKYTRNLIRLDVIPLLEKINTQLIESLFDSAQYIQEAEDILDAKIKEEFDKCCCVEDDLIYIDIKSLKKLKPIKSYLFYFLKPYGYNESNVNDILNSLENQSGKQFFSTSHQLLKDRDKLILSNIQNHDNERIIINNIDELNTIGFSSNITQLSDSFEINKSNLLANLDADKIKFPLVYRKWENGDEFHPLGMSGRKKVSDFLIDKKVDLFQKRNVKVLTQNDNIVWVVGYRISDDFKINKTTKRVLVIECKL